MKKRLKFASALEMRTILLAVLAGILVWLVVSQSIAAYLAETTPRAALWLNPQQPQALVNLADQMLNPASAVVNGGLDQPSVNRDENDRTSESTSSPIENKASLVETFAAVDQHRTVDLPMVRAWAEAALWNDPTNARALRVLGQAADAASDENTAYGFMRAAARYSLRESVSVYWLLLKSARVNDADSTIYYADVLLRQRPELGASALPILAQLTQDRQTRDLLLNVLKAEPPWRDAFIARLPNSVNDARIPLEVLLALASGSTPPAAKDIRPYLDALIAHGFYDLAYYTWLQFLPAAGLSRAGLLYNGDFDDPISGLPFDWEIMPGAGVTIDVVRQSDNSNRHALLIDFQYGRVDFRGAKELVLLPPGNYEFAAKFKGELLGPRGLKWRIACAGTQAMPLAESPMIIGKAADWREVKVAFTVPAKGCRAQYVRVDLDARSQSEQLVSGSVYFDRLQISRVRSAT